MTQRIEVPVPTGFPPMCEPVKPENRATNIHVVLASEKHLPAMAESFERSYPKAILDSITYPSKKRDVSHTIKRLSATLKAPDITMLVATLGPDGPAMGSASILKAARRSSDEHHMHIFRPAAFERGHNFRQLMGWTASEVNEMHSGLDTDLLENIMERQQIQREKCMGDHNYIMLGPIWVSSEYRSRGVGSKLIHKAFDMSRDARVPLLLSGVFPNAIPAYLHLGFESIDGYDDLMIWWPDGISRGELKHGRLI